MKSNKAFSFVEIIITVSIIALLWVIWFMVSTGSQEKSVNTRIASDLSVIDNSLAQYKQENSVLPDPKWNMNFFNSGSEYSHSATWAFWVHWFVTENLLPKKYMNYLPLDPKTNDYYAYGKTINNKFYEISWVVRSSWENKAKVSWNYPWETWPRNLIREYNWPNFVSNDSSESFPYNPDERVMTAKVSAFSWSVTITKVWVWSITDLEQILKTELREWDSIKVSVWSSANLYYSDWSNSTLWDSSSESELVFAKMFYKENSNLVTKVQLALINGTLWTKATKLSNTSEFEVLTTDSAAAVRWTIFWVKKEPTKTTTQVGVWSVNVRDISSFTDLSDLLSKIASNSVSSGSVINQTILVSETDVTWKYVEVQASSAWTVTSWDSFEEPEDLDFNNNEELEVDEIEVSASDKKFSFKVTEKIKKSDYFLVSNGTTDYLTKTNPQIIWENLVMTGWVNFGILQSSKILEKEKQNIYLWANLTSVWAWTPPTLSSILFSQRKVQISLCKQIWVNISCLPKKEITLVNYKKEDEKEIEEVFYNENIVDAIVRQNTSCASWTSTWGYILASQLNNWNFVTLSKNAWDLFSYWIPWTPTWTKIQTGTLQCNNWNLTVTSETAEVQTCNSWFSPFKANLDWNWEKVYCEQDLTWWYKLYAFAPYDSFTKKWNDYSDDDTRRKEFYWLYKKDGGYLWTITDWEMMWNGNRWAPAWNSASWTFISGSSNNSNPNHIDWAFSMNKDNHIMQIWWEEGVFIDNTNNDSFLKYSWLNLWNDFVIEMSVRGEDLKRIYPDSVTKFNAFFWLYYNSSLKIKNRIYWNTSEKKIWISDWINNSFYQFNWGESINNNSYYKVITRINSSWWNSYIEGTWISNNKTITVPLTNILSVWGYDNSNQFNWIINYVKIYK